MSEFDGNISVSDLIQIIRFGGDALNFMVKAGGFLNNKRKNATEKLKIKNMQAKLFLHYHSKAMSGKGKIKGMSLHTLEKLTGGNYSIINLPTEDPKKLGDFFKTLKKAKIAYSVLPDLVPGNGFSQIAIDPSQAHRMEAVLEVYDFEKGKQAKEHVSEEKRGKVIDFETYWESGNAEEKEKIKKSAMEEAEKESKEEAKKNGKSMKKDAKKETDFVVSSDGTVMDKTKTKEEVKKLIDFEKFQQRHMSRDYFPVTIDKKMVVAENEKAYVTRVPYSYKDGNFMLMTVDKASAVKTNGGNTILTHIRKDGQTYVCDKDKTNGRMVKNQELYQNHYSKFSTEFDRNNTKVHSRNKKSDVKIHTPKNLKK